MIETMFKEYAGKIDRLDIAWGIWSREMNLEINQRLKGDHPDSGLLGLVFSYWVVISQLLDIVYRFKGVRRFILKKRLVNKAAEAHDIREQIYAS